MVMRTLLAAAVLGLSQASFAAGDPAAGAAAWTEERPQADGSPPRGCATCHGRDLTQSSQHARTGKRIEPLPPLVNPERLNNPTKIEKWLRRNCRWTMGRDCTATEVAARPRQLSNQSARQRRRLFSPRPKPSIVSK